jgi:hypothetical protein
METTAKIEPTGSPVPGAKRVSLPRRRNPASILLAKLLSIVRGDKYLVDAYPPAWHEAARDDDGFVSHDGEGEGDRMADVRPEVALRPNIARGVKPADAETKER